MFRKDALLRKVAEQQIGGTLIIAGKVRYRDRKIIPPLSLHEYMIDWDVFDVLGPARYALYHLEQYKVPLFFEKLRDWRDECEWRVVVMAANSEPLYVSFAEALVGIIHGASMDEGVSSSIIEMTEGLPIEHMGLTWKNSVPWYNYEAGRWTATGRRANAARLPK